MSHFERTNLPGPSDSKARKTRNRAKARDYSRKLGERLKQAYTTERRLHETQRDGVLSTYRPAARFDGQAAATVEDNAIDSLWVKAAKTLYRQGIDPEDYVRRVFAMISGKVISCPRPNQLLSSRCMELYRNASVDLREEITLAFSTQRQIARREVVVKCNVNGKTVPVAMNETIRDESLPLSSLFRYCLALSMREKVVRRLAKRYKIDAALQYFPKREEYDQVWGEYIPDQFRQDAASIYEGISQQMV